MDQENTTKSSRSFSSDQKDSLRLEIANRIFYRQGIEQDSDEERKYKQALAQLSDLWDIDPRILERFVVEGKNPHQTTLDELFKKYDRNTLFPVENELHLRTYLDWGASVKAKFIVELHPPSSIGTFVDNNFEYVQETLTKLDTVTSLWNKDLPCSPLVYVQQVKNFPESVSTIKFFDKLKEGDLSLYANKVPSFLATPEHPHITQLVLSSESTKPENIPLAIDYQQLDLKKI